jgi:anti-sigma regulatory factor (Ser/Thr protein kinase)
VALGNNSTHNAGVPRSDQFDQEDPLLEPLAADVSPTVEAAVLMPRTADAEPTPATTEQWRAEFDFPGVLDLVPEHREQVMEFVDRHCPDEVARIDMLVAVQEALANAALHGCHDDPAKRIHCVVTADAREISVTVRDPGAGFDLTLADPERYQATKLKHGRGICLIRSLVSEVTFARQGAEIVMRKRLQSDE